MLKAGARWIRRQGRGGHRDHTSHRLATGASAVTTDNVSVERERDVVFSKKTTVSPADDGYSGQSIPSWGPGNQPSLSYIIEMVCEANDGDAQAVKIQYPIPASLAELAASKPWASSGEQISIHDALVIPSKSVSDQLVASFFKTFHPANPVFDRASFAKLYERGQMSPLVLHTIYMVALTCGPDHLIEAAGYSNRTSARKAHYLRAKALYDADHDPDPANVAASLHLLSFWWLGPDDQKDHWYWHGCAVTLVQSLGVHRS